MLFFRGRAVRKLTVAGWFYGRYCFSRGERLIKISPAMAEVLGATSDSLRHHLRVLQQENIVRRHGPTKGGYWEVVGEQD